MKLVIAEKPSVAFAIAKTLGVKDKRNGYIENGEYIISWCIGHLIALADPTAYNEQYGKWSFEDLPIIPDTFKYKIYPDKQKQFKIVKELMHRKDINEVINACDAGREGELIFRLVYNQANCKKKYKRLWISSMEENAIRDGFNNLKDGKEYDNLYNSALCRLWADWIVGINATRLFSLLYRKTLNIGRVQTPTLALLSDRHNAISFFKPEKYYTITLNADSVTAESSHIESKEKAEKIIKSCENSQAICISVSSAKKEQKPPKLFDLTALQREANRIYGYTAKQTLDYAQALYEKKLITYPRTDSRFLTADMKETVRDIVTISKSVPPFDKLNKYTCNADIVINNAKVTDHHAIIPTAELGACDLSGVPNGEMNILKLVICKLLAAVADSMEYESSTALISYGDCDFTVKGKIIKRNGFKDIEKLLNASSASEDKTPTLPELKEGQIINNAKTALSEHLTTPPTPYTEDSLLSAMENASSKETTKEAERKGLGTPATRASIIEKIVNVGFAERKGKQIIPTKNGNLLISVLPETLISASRTAEWENTLALIAKGQADPKAFMQGIKNEVAELIKKYSAMANNNQDIFNS